jgi:hypothetical protein
MTNPLATRTPLSLTGLAAACALIVIVVAILPV